MKLKNKMVYNALKKKEEEKIRKMDEGVKFMNLSEKQKDILLKCNFLFNNDTPLKDLVNKEIIRILESGYIDYSNYDFQNDGYQLMKLLNYLALKRTAESFKPLDTQFMKKYKSLIKNY
jgi:hypothetical protein